jgi:Fur family ferric uptake transcriptional regulator
MTPTTFWGIIRYSKVRSTHLFFVKSKLATMSSTPVHAKQQHSPDAAESQLRDAGVRVTQARISVLDTLLKARNAMSHQDVQDALTSMDRVTLYRALDCLTEAGLTHKIASDDRIFRYSVGKEHSEHQHAHKHGQHAQHQHGHFKCTRCSRVFCLDGSSYAGLLESVLPTSIKNPLQSALQTTLGKGFQSHDVELTIKGFCADCAKA